MKKPKSRQDPKIKNRVHQTTKFEWARGAITIHAMVDKYPAGNFVTYSMSVGRRRKEIRRTKSGKPIFDRAEVIERNTYAMAHSDRMMARVEYFQSLPKEMAVE
jgi:hypothetical protein